VLAGLHRWVLGFALAGAVWGWAPVAAAGDVFWVAGAHGNQIGRANDAGTRVDPSFVSGLRDVGALAVGAGHLYWTSGSSIGRGDLGGGSVKRAFIPGLGPLNGIAVTGRRLYWLSERNPGCGGKPGFGRARLSGTDVQRGFVCGAGGGQAIADAPYVNQIGVWGRYLYWSWIGGIGRLDTDHRTFVSRFIVLPSGHTVAGVTAAADHLYWGSYDLGPVIGRAKLDGRAINTTFIQGLSGNIAPEVAALDHRLYFSNDYGSAATIARSTLTGVVNWDFIAGLHVVGGLAAGRP